MNENNAKHIPHYEQLTTRREMLVRGGAGFGALALASLLNDHPLSGAVKSENPLAPKAGHYPAKAKSVIFLFMEGGPSHLDTFDYKPALNKLAGKPLPSSFKKPITAMGEANSPILASKRKWKKCGESGMLMSDWVPHLHKHADDLAVIRSCWSKGINHAGGMSAMHTGTILGGRPSLGTWVNYGLGTVNQNLPGFVVMFDRSGSVVGGPRMYGTAFMPAVYQGAPLQSGTQPFANLKTPSSVSQRRQKAKLAYLDKLNQEHLLTREQNNELEARIRSYELAFRMQATAPEAVDLSQEDEATKEMYGLNDKKTQSFGRNCLLARRLVERGVRYIHLYSGVGSKWDAHSGMEKNHTDLFGQVDQPISALLTDLKQRGMLEETLVIWGGEFGRTPMSEKGNGRDHNPTGFTMWLAGGGVSGGQVIGSTDELGLHAVEDRMHIHDLHATFLHLMGLDHTKLLYEHKGRPERPTVNEGEIYHKITTV